jgi:sucrose-6-phosphate hydrolase SacC (GH32 family)
MIQAKEANEILHSYSHADCLRVQFTIQLSHATDAGFNLYGQQLMRYDMNFNLVNGVFYSPEDMTSMEISADIIIDKNSVEVFIDGGVYSYSIERKADPDNREGFHFWGNQIEIKDLKVYLMHSIWE